MADAAKVKELRAHFLDKYSGSILDDTYDDRDVKWVKKCDALLTNVLNAHKSQGDVKKGADMLNEILLWRAKIGINDIKESDLNQELVQKNPVYFHGVDKSGLRILHFRVAASKKGHLVEDGKKIIAYHLNQHYMANPDQQMVLLFDFTDAGVSNMDLDVSKFIITAASVYFPECTKYNLNFKMGLALEAVWKIISGWLDPVQAKNTKMVKRTNIQEYINKDQLLPHMIKEDKKK